MKFSETFYFENLSRSRDILHTPTESASVTATLTTKHGHAWENRSFALKIPKIRDAIEKMLVREKLPGASTKKRDVGFFFRKKLLQEVVIYGIAVSCLKTVKHCQLTAEEKRVV